MPFAVAKVMRRDVDERHAVSAIRRSVLAIMAIGREHREIMLSHRATRTSPPGGVDTDGLCAQWGDL